MNKSKTLFLLMSMAVCLLTSCCQNQSSIPTNKKEIMDSFVAGTLDPSYVPAAFFVHYGSDEKLGNPAVQAHLRYFLKSNMDILKVQFEQVIPRIEDPSDPAEWEALKPLPEDFYAPTLEIIKSLNEIAGDDVYVIPTIYSPYQVSLQALGEEGMREALINHPDGYRKLIGYCMDALNWLIDKCKEEGIEGFYMCCQGGEIKHRDIPQLFTDFVKPTDLELFGNCAKGTKMNFLHICDWEGPYDDITRYADYPGQIVNTPINVNGEEFTTLDGEKLFNRPILGGLDRKGEINKVSVGEVASLAAEAIEEGPAGKLMLGAECTVSSAPWENIHAAISAAHHYGQSQK